MKISVVIINFNSWDDTKDCLTSLSKLDTDHEVSVVVVDNASKLHISNNKLQFTSLPIDYLFNKENLGFAGGNNVGITHAIKRGADYVILLNNDTVVHPQFVDKLARASEELNNKAIIGPKIYFEKGYEYHKDRYDKSELGKVFWYAGGKIDWKNVYASHRGVDKVDSGQFDKQIGTDFVSGCCMLIPRSVVDVIGVLDDKYFLYYEDTDYCLRAKKSGYKLIYEPASIIWHKNAQSSGKSGSDLQVYYQTRNRMLFGMRFASARTKIALIRESIRLILGGGIRRRAIIDYYFGRLGKR